MVITGLTRNQFDGNVRGKRTECQRSALSGEAGNEVSLLARKGERSPHQGLRATIERTGLRIPPAEIMKAPDNQVPFQFPCQSLVPCDIIPPLPWSGIEVVITGLTRNQFDGNVTWVRIPPAPPT